MLRSLKEISGYRVESLDGAIGSIKDFYFDDLHWRIRYFVVDTGNWLPGRKVLVNPRVVKEPHFTSQSVQVAMPKQRIENSPSIDFDQSVSRETEVELAKYYGWPHYWAPRDAKDVPVEGEQNLRSASEVFGYKIDAKDGNIGHVEDLIAETETQQIHYVVVDTRNWLPGGKKVLLDRDWIERISWTDRACEVDLLRQTIENGPEYNPTHPVNREIEARFYDYYGRPKYWEGVHTQ